VQVVHITSPNRFHFEQAKAVLQAGKHVICEKPLALTSMQTAELVGLAGATNAVSAVCYNARFYPLCLEARQRCLDGEPGPIHHIMGSYLQDWLLFDTDFNWRVRTDSGGETRAISDIGTHWMDLLSFITGLKIVQVCADLRTVHAQRLCPETALESFQQADPHRAMLPVPIDTEDFGSVLLRFHNGARGVFTVSQVNAGRKNCIQFEIAGARSSLSWNSENPNSLAIGHRDRPNESLPRDPRLMGSDANLYSSYPGGHAEGYPDTFKQLFRAIYDAIGKYEAGGKRRLPTLKVPYPTFNDAHQQLLLCEAILASHRQGRWIEVAPAAR
jgi:predicted dehydrogenase